MDEEVWVVVWVEAVVEVGVVVRSGCECVHCAGQPPLFRRGDEATTPSEEVAARTCNVDGVVKEEDLRLVCMYPGVGPAVGRCPERALPQRRGHHWIARSATR